MVTLLGDNIPSWTLASALAKTISQSKLHKQAINLDSVFPNTQRGQLTLAAASEKNLPH